MTKAKLLTLFCAALLLALSHASARAAQATQAGLVKAWEEVQREDPETVTFEKTGEGRYRFKTNRFPFDGELKILKANINDYSYGDDDSPAVNYVTGVIEYDLVGLSEELSKKYAHSIEDWEGSNTLYFDKDGGAWLSADEQRVKMRAKYKEQLDEQQRKKQQEQQQQQLRQQQEQTNKSYSLWLNLASWWGPVLLLVAFWVWFFKRTGFRRHREYMNMSVAHMQRVDELLERIAEALEKRNAETYARPEASEYRSQPPA